MKKIWLQLMITIIIGLFSQPNYSNMQQQEEHLHSHGMPQYLQKREERYQERMYWQMPLRVMEAIGVRPGQAVADVGCGIGYFTLRLAEKVTESGRVFASDIDDQALHYLRNKAEAAKFNNIRIIKGRVDDPLLPAGQMDLVLIVNTIHLIKRPGTFFERIAASLNNTGKLVIIQWDAEKMDSEAPDWLPEDREKYTQRTMLRTIYDAQFEVLRILDFLPMQTIYICQPSTSSRKI